MKSTWIDFLRDAKTVLRIKYSEEQTAIVVDWFERIKGSEEADLIGSDRLRACADFIAHDEHWNVYDTGMARLWIYAPHILAEAGALYLNPDRAHVYDVQIVKDGKPASDEAVATFDMKVGRWYIRFSSTWHDWYTEDQLRFLRLHAVSA